MRLWPVRLVFMIAFVTVPDIGYQALLKSLLDCTIDSSANTIHSSLAQRTFELYFPRLTIRSALETDWEDGHEAIQDATVRFVYSPQLSVTIIFHRMYTKYSATPLVFRRLPLPQARWSSWLIQTSMLMKASICSQR